MCHMEIIFKAIFLKIQCEPHLEEIQYYMWSYKTIIWIVQVCVVLQIHLYDDLLCVSYPHNNHAFDKIDAQI